MSLSTIQNYKPSSIITATIVILCIIVIAALLQFHVIPTLLLIPIFLIPVSLYTTILGFMSKKEIHMTQDYSYYFSWAGIMMAVGIGWIVLYEKMDLIFGVIAIFSIVLAYVYMNKIKSSMINFKAI